MAQDGFTIKNEHNCRLVFGPLPISDFPMLLHGFSKKAQMALDIADRIGASFVIGEPADLEALRKLDLPVSEKRQREAAAALKTDLAPVAEWLLTGERGASANAMCKHIFGVLPQAGTSHPHDPSDLRRCLKFLDATNAHDKVSLMADVSPEWGRLVAVWPQLIYALNQEMVSGACVPNAYALMREAIG